MRWTDARGALPLALVLVAVLAGPVSAQPAPPSLSILDVPYISQSEALCGGAAAAMVMRYWGERGVTAESFEHLVDRSAAGIRTDILIGELRQRGWNATGVRGRDGDVARELDAGRPALVLIEDRPGTFHYVVVVAQNERAVVFHDPARAPLRVQERAEFERRWNAADRWMAVIVPGDRAADGRGPAAEPPPPASTRETAGDACTRLVADGVERARAGDIEDAARTLASALGCPGPAAMRELAGVRLLQRRWDDVEALARGAVTADATDVHAWRLLGTSLFLQDRPSEALDAWNRAGEPTLDLVAADGLERTRQRVVERLLGERPGEVLTRPGFERARRRLQDLPSAIGARLEYVPVPSGLAELRATIFERSLVATDPWTYVAVGAIAASRRQADYTFGSFIGGGERLALSWRFWPDRPRYAAEWSAPAPWGGIVTALGAVDEQAFDRPDLAPAERRTLELGAGNWVTSTLHLKGRAGIDAWKAAGRFASAGGQALLRTPGERVEASFGATTWIGGSRFGAATARIAARSSSASRGLAVLARGGAAVVSDSAPPDLWIGGDTGRTREPLLRAHPLVSDGALRTAQLGRTALYGSVEARHWREISLVRAAAAIFADAVRVDRRLDAGSRTDVDVGVGARLAVPGLPGIFRVDVARGLRDGDMAWSFVYEPSGW